MAEDNVHQQIVMYLTDVHGTEENAIGQLRTGAESVHDPQLTQVRDHLTETEEHERLVRSRLEALDASPSVVKDTLTRGSPPSVAS